MKLIMETWRRYINEEDDLSDEEIQQWRDRNITKGSGPQANISKTKQGGTPKYATHTAINQVESEFGAGIAQLVRDPDKWKDGSWLERNIGPLKGFGFFRAVYEIKGKPEYIFKVAKPNKRGQAGFTNEKEKKYFNKYPEFMPKVYLADDTITMGGGTPEREDFVDWLIVEKVKIPELDDYNKLILNAFPGFKKAIEYSKFLNVNSTLLVSPDEYLELTLKTIASSKELSDQSLTRFKEILKQEYKGSKMSFLSKGKTTPEKYADNVWDMINNDHMFTKFRAMISELKIQYWDIRVDNIGTRTGKEFLLIDIGIFKKRSGQFRRN